MKHGVAMAEGPTITRADLPEAVRDALERQAGDTARAIPDSRIVTVPVIDVEVLRQHIRSTPPPKDDAATTGMPAHVDHAKRTWLAALIDECGGDLALIVRFWDRRSEKTLRNLIRTYGLGDHLAVARSRAARKNAGKNAPPR